MKIELGQEFVRFACLSVKPRNNGTPSSLEERNGFFATNILTNQDLLALLDTIDHDHERCMRLGRDRRIAPQDERTATDLRNVKALAFDQQVDIDVSRITI